MNPGNIEWLSGGEWVGVAASPFIGSFVAAAVDRYARDETFITGRSRCDHCGVTLQAWDLFPVLSWVALQGRCRTCDNPIGWWSSGVELGYLVMTAVTFTMSSGAIFWVGCLLGWTLLALALVDLRTMLLPDRMTLPLVAAGLAVSALFGRAAIFDRTEAAALGFLGLYLVARAYRALARREGLGMGDAKLFAATGAWLGTAALPGALLIAAVTALLIETARRTIFKQHDRFGQLAFGPYLALATWVGWVFGPLIPVSA